MYDTRSAPYILLVSLSRRNDGGGSKIAKRPTEREFIDWEMADADMPDGIRWQYDRTQNLRLSPGVAIAIHATSDHARPN